MTRVPTIAGADLTDALRRLDARVDAGTGRTVFGGWSRFAVPVSDAQVVRVAKPKVGSVAPSEVLATLAFDVRPSGPEQLGGFRLVTTRANDASVAEITTSHATADVETDDER